MVKSNENAGGLRVLLIEDDPIHARIMRRALDRMDITSQVTLAMDGEAGLECLERECQSTDQRPLLVFLDLRLPRCDGIDVLHRIKSDLHKSALPVIIISSTDDDATVKRCYRLGANAYISKDPLELVDRKLHAVCDFWTQVARLPSSLL